MILVENVTKEYRTDHTAVHALRGVSLEVQAGEFLAIAGPSGSGKTTLLNLIGCLDVPSSGEIRIEGEPVSGKSRVELATLRRHKLGFVFQTFNLIPVLSAYENVSFALALLGVEGRELKERTLKMLQEVGLAGLEKRKPGELSGGQRQRVAIARALINNPSIIFADEPTGNLDSRTGDEIMAIFERLNERGATIMLVTHEPDIAKHARRIISIRDGRVTSDEAVVSKAATT
jgi:putative ABC transport system ATP-binding protein